MPEATVDAPRTTCKIILRPWPKVIFFYPTMLTAIIVGLWQYFDSTPASEQHLTGLIFFSVLCLNLLVISFEFSRIKTVSIIFGCFAAFFLFLWLGDRVDVLGFFKGIFSRLGIYASSAFYLLFGGYLAAVFLGIFVNTRWNYWEVQHNEIVHKSGFLGDIRRFPSPNLKMTKEISDVFEFLLLGSGRIILYPASEKEAIVLDNILNVNRAEREMKDLLSSIEVEIAEKPTHQHGTPPEDH